MHINIHISPLIIGRRPKIIPAMQMNDATKKMMSKTVIVKALRTPSQLISPLGACLPTTERGWGIEIFQTPKE